MASEPEPGTVLDGRYRLEQPLGEGGIGTVWEAAHLVLGRRVAVKLLHPKYARDGELLVRFRREAEASARLDHPHIVEVSDFAAAPGGPAYMVMELLRGESLRDRIEREAPLPAETVVTVARQALEALGAAHAAGVVHRDLKPDNIFLAEREDGSHSVKLLDFGLARLDDVAGLTKTGTTVGTPLYMPPEQVRASKVDHRADLWSLGASLYEALTGRPPFEAKAYGELVAKIVGEEPTPLTQSRPDAPAALVRAVEAALEKDVDRRPPSAAAMRAIIDAGTPAADDAQRRAALEPTMKPGPAFASPPPKKHATPGKQQVAFVVKPESFRPPPPRASQAAATPRPVTRQPPSRRWLVVTLLIATPLVAAGTVAAILALEPAGAPEITTAERTPPPAQSEAPPAEPPPVAPIAVDPAAPGTVAGETVPTATEDGDGRREDEGSRDRHTRTRRQTAEREERHPAESDAPPDGPSPSEPAEDATERPDEEPTPSEETRAETFATAVRTVGVSGDYDLWAAESHLATAQPRFERCVATASVPPGRATFTVVIEADGSVSSVGGAPEDARQCLWQAARRVPWMPPPGGARATVRATYRFVEE